MHTFTKSTSESVYTIGVLVQAATGGDVFVRLFDVLTLQEAVAAVNVLNGGGAKFPHVYHEYDDLLPPAS